MAVCDGRSIISAGTVERRLPVLATGLTLAMLLVSCGGASTPMQPSGNGGPGGGVTPPANNLPVIDAITIQGTRPKEPADFADLGEGVTITAKVHDDETPAGQLEYQWSAAVGTFSGTGASVLWTAPASASAPQEVTITLKVVEKYGNPGGPLSFSHDVSGTATLSLHDSVREVGDMARQFLLDFSDSTIRDVAFILRNFTVATKACRDGTSSETSDVTENRKNYFIQQWSVGSAATTINFGGTCPFRAKPGDACAQVPTDWLSRRLTPPDGPGGTPQGGTEHVVGVDQVTAIYVAEQKKWGLCDSAFNGHYALVNRFIR